MKRILLIALAVLPLFNNIGYSQFTPTHPPLYATYTYGDSLFVYPDSTTFAVDYSLNQQLIDTSAAALDISQTNGLAVHPCTGEFWAVFQIVGQSGRSIGTVDITNGICQIIGNTGENIAGIAFVNDTVLAGVSGDGGNVSENLYLIDINTAVITSLTALGGGSDGETIGFCTDDGMIYHWSGRDTSPEMSRIDPATGINTVIARTGYNYDEVFAATYMGNGEFLLANLDQEFVIVDTSGFAVNTGFATNEYNKGLAFPNRYVWFATDSTDTICPYGDATTLVASSGADAYQWYRDGSMIAGANSDTLMASMAGSYKCEITRGSCVSFSLDSISVQVYAVDTAVVTPPLAEFCAGDSIVYLGNDGGFGTEWWNDSTMINSTDTYTAMTPGTFSYHLYSANGCYDQLDIAVTMNPLPTVMAMANDTSYCEGEMITLTGSGADTYSWDNSVVDGTPFSQAVGSPVTYTVTGTDTNGCVNTATIDINVHPNPAVTLTGTDELLGSDGTIDLTIVGGTGLTYDWDNDGTGDFDDPEDLSGLDAGTYTVVVMAPTGCTTTESITIGSQVGLEEFGADAGLSIYPNPNNGIFNVELFNMNTEKISLKVVNSIGQVVVDSRFESSVLPVNIQDMGAGVYNIVITDGEHTATQQIIVK